MPSNSCNTSIQYMPVPPRVWSRVQNSCSLIAYEKDDPAANSNFSRADYERQMLLKGNILQYKKNSSSLTKKQKYTQIAKGMWTNRTKTWATQSDTYTNPNMTSLLRVNSSVLNPSNNIFSSPPNPFGCPTTEIQDGGNLVCNVIVDPCTQEVIERTKSQQLCNPTTDSDVPGQIQDLCWNDGTQTWYPRQRYIMPTSGSKWPQGYKGFVSALKPDLTYTSTTFPPPLPPIVTSYTLNYKQATINWTNTDPTVTSYALYCDELLITHVSSSVLTYTYKNLVNGLSYLLQVSAFVLGSESTKDGSSQVLPSTSGYFTGGSGVINGSNYVITFETTGKLTYTCPVPATNISVLVVGGGGGGGVGVSGGGGGGGGGGFSTLSTNISITNISYDVIIGSGGIGAQSTNGGNGGPSSIFNITNNGGTGGTGGTGGVGNGTGGTGGVGNGTGGNGGDNGISGGRGGGGGGGGGGGYDSNSRMNGGAGSPGGQGYGGDGGINGASIVTNANATKYGGGGGGTGGVNGSSTGQTGGSGYAGVVVLIIPN